jgi:hypothetical protein
VLLREVLAPCMCCTYMFGGKFTSVPVEGSTVVRDVMPIDYRIVCGCLHSMLALHSQYVECLYVLHETYWTMSLRAIHIFLPRPDIAPPLSWHMVEHCGIRASRILHVRQSWLDSGVSVCARRSCCTESVPLEPQQSLCRAGEG